MAGTGERSPLLGGTPPKGCGTGRAAALAAAALERAAFVGVTANLGVFLSGSAFGWGVAQASRARLLFLGAAELLAPVGGWVADVYLGRRGAVVLGFSLYLLAASLLPVTATLDGRLSVCGQLPAETLRNGSGHQGQPPELYCAPTIYSGLLLLALSVGCVRANLVPFGADQVGDQGSDATRHFFNWLYWSINIGAVFSLLVVAFVQQNVSFLAGYLIPVACLALALLVFLLAIPTFVTKPPTGSQVSAIIKLALRSCGCAWLGGTGESARRWEASDHQPNDSGAQPGAPSPEEDLENFQMLARLLPVLLAFIPHWTVSFQLQQTCRLQALHLHIPGTLQTSAFPGAWLLLGDPVVLLALVPVKDRVLDPFLARRKLLPSALNLVTLGVFFGLASILAAGFLERERLRYVHLDRTVPQLIGEDWYVAATLPVWWQVPQHLLMAISELFTSVPGLEFAYAEAPRSMKGAVMGLFFLTAGLGSLLGWGLQTLLSLPAHGWTHCPKDHGSINRCRMDNYLFLLAGIQSITCLLFAWISRGYRSHPPRPGTPRLCTGPGEG